MTNRSPAKAWRFSWPADSSVEVVGSCADGHSAVAMIRAQSPDLVFLDVQMPKLDGFQVLAELKPKERPMVIFVTAYDEYAVRAFEFSAVDYLLKPFRDARFAAALVRAKQEIRHARTSDLDQRVEQLLGYVRDLTRDNPSAPATAAAPTPASAPEYADRIVLKTGSDLHFIKTQDVIWIEAQGDFVKVQTTGQAQLVRETFAEHERTSWTWRNFPDSPLISPSTSSISGRSRQRCTH